MEVQQNNDCDCKCNCKGKHKNNDCLTASQLIGILFGLVVGSAIGLLIMAAIKFH